MPKIFSIEEFIKKARKVHGNKYDYSKVDYKNSHTKVKIICTKHGEFLQTPNSHLNGHGCPQCAGLAKLTTEEFIKRARAIHGSKYDYSKVDYKKSGDKVTVICPKHGQFTPIANNHLRGSGCKKCTTADTPQCKPKTTKWFIKKARKVHGNRYDYSKVDYKRSNIKVTIICPIHGEFKETPSEHLEGHGCLKCAVAVRQQNIPKTTKWFIKKARKVHGNRYDYSKVDYKRCDSKVIIICPIHGEFLQTPSAHYNGGQGCPCCNGGWYGPDDLGIINLYLILCKMKSDIFCKIGITRKSLKDRFPSNKKTPFKIINSVIISGIAGEMFNLETQIKKEFKKAKYIPKIKFGGFTECFEIGAFNKIKRYLSKYTEHEHKKQIH